MEKTIFTNRWYALRPSKELKLKKPIEVPVLGHNVVLWRNKDKQVIVQDNRCPHRGAKLSMGKIKDNSSCIECPYHGWKFDDTGVLKDIPAEEKSHLVDKLCIKNYEVVESGGLIWFCPGTPSGLNPPVIQQMTHKEWISVTGQDVFDNDWVTTLENSIDVTHVNFVHSDFGDNQNGKVSIDKITESKNQKIKMYSTINHKSENLLLKFTEQNNLTVKHDIFLPNTVSIQFWVKDILDVITYVTYTPLENNKTMLNWVFLRSPRLLLFDGILDYFFIEGMKKAIIEDKRIVNSIVNPENRINIEADSVQVKFRAKLKELKLNEPSTDYHH